MVSRVAVERQGIQSIEVGFRLLRALAATNKSMMLRDIAAYAGMPAAKAHRYLVSFMRVGLVEQDAASGRYDLGAYAVELGLAGLARLDPLRFAGPILEELCEKIDETVAIAVWGSRGATIVRIVDSGGPITITLRAGTVLPLTKSATGRAFAAFYNAPFVKKLLDEELREAAASSGATLTNVRREIENTLAEIRERGISRATASLMPGINGFSAPVYDHAGGMVAAITSLGAVGEFNSDWDSPVATAMMEAAAALSRRIGAGYMVESQNEPPARSTGVAKGRARK